MSDLAYSSLDQIHAPVSRCYVRLPFAGLGGTRWRLEDLPGPATYDREGSDLDARGLYLDEPPWKSLVFSLTEV